MQEKTPLFSIIVPCFNSEKTIKYCIESITEQNFSDYEIICLDDGSEDNTINVIKTMQLSNDKIKLFHHPNRGVSYTRNRGILESKGKYILFVDSDDWLHYRALSIVAREVSDTDIDCYIFGIKDIGVDFELRNAQLDNISTRFNKRIFSFDEAKDELLYIFGGVSTKVIKRSLIIENNIRFDVNLKNAEDTCFSLVVLSKCKRIYVNNNSLYFYRKPFQGNSLTCGHVRFVEESLYAAIEKLKGVYPEYLIIDRFMGTMLYVVNRPDYYLDKDSIEILRKCVQRIPFEMHDRCKNINKTIKWIDKSSAINLSSIKRKIKNKKLEFRKMFKSFRVNKIRKNYETTIKRLKIKYSIDEKIEVAFLFNEFEKIKTESLINELSKNNHFDVTVLITSLKEKFDIKQKKSLDKIEDFCKNNQIKYKLLYNPIDGTPIEINKADFDIIFYQQPWAIHKCHSIDVLSKNSLLCYVPYFLPNYGNLKLDCQRFHALLFRFYVLNDAYADEYRQFMSELDYNICVAGHPMLDIYSENNTNDDENNVVVYAPHWSIGKGTVNYSTFVWSGYSVLEFAEKHPEIQWVFRPHPRLFMNLKNKGFMSQVEIDNYIYRWNQISTFDYSVDYLKIFAKSKCLITDCGSFLTEYFPTGKPVIRMVNDLANQPCDAFKDIINLYYNVYSSNELYQTLEKVLVYNKDCKKLERVKKAGDFYSNYIKNRSSAKRIVEDIEMFIKNYHVR